MAVTLVLSMRAHWSVCDTKYNGTVTTFFQKHPAVTCEKEPRWRKGEKLASDSYLVGTHKVLEFFEYTSVQYSLLHAGLCYAMFVCYLEGW